jgi:ATPase components of ABC transporters with duplicated ATPase domains
MTNAVSFQKLSFAYPKGPPVFTDYTFEILQSSVFAVLGPNGRGKTILFKILLGLLKV